MDGPQRSYRLPPRKALERPSSLLLGDARPIVPIPMENPPPSSWNAMGKLGNIFYNTVGSVTTNISHLVKSNLLDDNHAWKQQKYEYALAEWIHGFSKLSHNKPQVLLNLLDSDRHLKASPLAGALKDVLRSMLQTHDDHRSIYYGTLSALRQALELPQFSIDVANLTSADGKKERVDQLTFLLLQLCEAFFSTIHLYSFCEWLVDRIIDMDTLSHERNCLSAEDFETFDRACNSSMGAVRVAVGKGCLQGYVNVNFDPAMQQNIPFVLADIPICKLRQTKTVRLLRLASPTIEGYATRAKIAPEFTHFLVSLATQNKNHLYVSLQCDIPRLVGDESERNRVIKDLQASHPNLSVLVLDQESDFYEQSGDFSDLSKEKFLALFIKRLFADDCGYYFPDTLKNDQNYRYFVKTLLQQAAYISFTGDDMCSPMQRNSCIEIFHAILTLFTIKYMDVDTANVSCKDSIDRAMKTITLMFQIIAIARGKALDPTYQKILKVFALAPAFMVKKQAMTPDDAQASCPHLHS
jgi:hypothetical protein